MTDREMVLELCWRIKRVRLELEPYLPALLSLHGGDKKSEKEIDRLERNLGIPGAAWSLSGALETVLAEWHHQKNAADMMLAVLRRDGPAESA